MEVEIQNDRVWIGEFGISPGREGMLWIEHESGEGMEVREALFAEWLAEFYDEHF